ncbi:MAG: bifunctional YncE family protein/alkaline phosphatase family protein [Verrucomicrobiota bacterium]
MKSSFFIRFGLIAFIAFSFQRIFAGDFDATTEIVGRGANGLVTPVNQLVTPAGVQVELPRVRPNALALSPDGKMLVTAGLTHELIVVDPAAGEILQRVPFPAGGAREETPIVEGILNPDGKAQLSFTGLAFSPDGSRIYMANVNGDIKVFGVGGDRKVSPLFSIALPPANAPRRTNDIPAGIAVSRDGKKIYVAGNLSNRLLEFDAATGKVLRTWEAGVAPFDVVLAGKKIYVSNWGGRRPDANSVTGPAGRGTLVRVDDRSIASEGSVSVIDLTGSAGILPAGGSSEHAAKMAALPDEILTGLHACALALSPNKKYLAVANAGSDTVSVIDTRADKIVETICARQNPADLFGAQPNALAFDKSGKTLFVCNGTQNAVAVFQFKPGESKLLGLIPAGWFPGAIAFDARDGKLCIANLKDIAVKMQKPKPGLGAGAGFNTLEYAGSLSLIPLPTKRELEKFTQMALVNLRYPLLAQAKLLPRANQPAQPVPERAGEPGVFQHVIYIIKENRTYDQILGDVTNGNGSAELCAFGGRVTPNQHKLVRDFALLDNTYCCGILSADGHNWTDSGIATDYLERSFAGWPRSYPSGGFGEGGADALAYSPAGFIWNDALAHGKTVCDFGEFTTDKKHWKSSGSTNVTFLDAWRDFIGGSNAIACFSEPDIEALRPFIVTNTVGWDLSVPDVWRAAQFIKSLKQFEAADNLPNLVIVLLPNDHTSGTKTKFPTPAAMVADNDLAMGQIVEAVSHSKFWTNTCIFAVEDDPQNGWDHVSGYRTTAYVASAYTRRGAVVHTQYNQTSLLRTMELMLGLPPMNQMDATATPMFDCFTNQPDFTAFDAVTNNVPLDEMNKSPRQISDAQLRKDAIVSAKLPLDKEDQCPEDVFNRILWRAMKGTQTPYPEWAVKVVDDD